MSDMSKHQTILVVEDNDDDYEVTVRALKKDGNLLNSIVRCESGAEALQYLYANSSDKATLPAIVLLDLNMPGRDGRSVLSEIKGHPDLQHIPVVVLTTSDDQRDIQDCYRLGANTYIQKPVDLDRFFRAMKELRSYWFGIAVLPKAQ